MERIIKTEVQPNGEILLFYMDENGENEEGVITTIENIEHGQLEPYQENYVIEEVNDSSVGETNFPPVNHTAKERWLDEETRRLLIFYIDNKETFISGQTKKKHLWTVACKTVLTNKNPEACDLKLRNLKRKYGLIRLDLLKHKANEASTWPYYNLCNQAFHDDNYINLLLAGHTFIEKEPEDETHELSEKANEYCATVVQKINQRSSVDEKVKQMLELYLQYKKNSSKLNDYWQRNVWEKIAYELGDDADYWHKRFLNFKQHYIRILDKRKESSSDIIHWPYVQLFDEIFEDDVHFQRKYGEPPIRLQKADGKTKVDVKVIPDINLALDWNDTEKTVLVKYYFDCFDEFRDVTIPKDFLWNEVGRLLDRIPDSCRTKYEELKQQHIDRIIEGGYDLHTRKPIEILFDNIISKETEIVLCDSSNIPETLDVWETELLDELVQFTYDNLEMFKDSICHFVCWAVISKKLGQSIHHCRHQWRDLSTLYKSLLDDKKEHPDMQIDWRYIELFERIFDYGMDMKLLDGYEIYNKKNSKNDKKENKKVKDDLPENDTEEEYEERPTSKRSMGTGDPKQFKILDYYQKHKDKFSSTQNKKMSLWEGLADKIGISAEQCAHRFRNLKQVYKAYVQREINKPEMPIVWPYYALCKKVFGYRAIKNKLKKQKARPDEKEWSPSDIIALITYFGQNFHEITNNSDDKSKWFALSRQIGKTETTCREKFIDLRKSYRKIKTMMRRNPDCKVNWQYFNMFDDIYTQQGPLPDSVDTDAEERFNVPLELPSVKMEVQDEDDDYQCIIVIPEGGDLTDLRNAQIIVKDANQPDATETSQTVKKPAWSKKNRKLLLTHYYNYIKSHEGQVINRRIMWKEIASKFPNKSLISCKRVYMRLKSVYKQQKQNNEEVKKTPIYNLMEKILSLRPKFVRPPIKKEDVVLEEKKTYTDIVLTPWKVERALKYYLEHVEEFVNPKYDKKYAWIDLAKDVDLNVVKVFRKINYLKQFFNSETNEVNGEKVEFGETLKKILEKEFLLKVLAENEPKAMVVDEEPEISWSDDEIEQLLTWYLENLEKFKNPKYITSYLWMEASNVMKKTPLACSKKMSEIRTLYSSMVKEIPEELKNWRFYDLCQKIYGTGKKSTPVNSD